MIHRSSSTTTPHRVSPRHAAVLAVAVPLATIAGIGAVAHVAADAAGQQHGSPTTQRTCYPRDQWSTGTVPASQRPCARVVRIWEDGSVRLAVSDADGTVRYTVGIGAQDR
jgi:hypothetical protein